MTTCIQGSDDSSSITVLSVVNANAYVNYRAQS